MPRSRRGVKRVLRMGLRVLRGMESSFTRPLRVHWAREDKSRLDSISFFLLLSQQWTNKTFLPDSALPFVSSAPRPSPTNVFRPQPFVTKLHFALEHPQQYGDVLRWTQGGLSFFVCLSNPRFAVEVLPKLFSHDSLTSFTRQLSVSPSSSPRFPPSEPPLDSIRSKVRKAS